MKGEDSVQIQHILLVSVLEHSRRPDQEQDISVYDLVYWHEQIWTKSEEQFRPDKSVFRRNPAGF